MLQIDAIYGNQEPAKSLILPIRASRRGDPLN
jgi:hypothetical protein